MSVNLKRERLSVNSLRVRHSPNKNRIFIKFVTRYYSLNKNIIFDPAIRITFPIYIILSLVQS